VQSDTVFASCSCFPPSTRATTLCVCVCLTLLRRRTCCSGG
jgi:hypothetical protein